MPSKFSDHYAGIGPGIEELGILDKPVVVTNVSITERSMRGEDKPFVVVTLKDGRMFHAWSPVLAERLSHLDSAALSEGVECTFKRVATAGGFRALTVE